jgi:N-formylglutamate amidohydrolase
VKHISPIAFVALFAACSGSETPASAPVGVSYQVGRTVTDPQGWIEYTPGDAPLVIIAPHGGLLVPAQLPDRTCSGCVTVTDVNTQELARAIVQAFQQRTGALPHLVVNRLSRRKFDANRDRVEATGGNAALDAPWLWMHAAIDSAKASIARRHGRGLVIDLHGHAHDIHRLELGYLLSASELRLSDGTLTAQAAMTGTALARLASDTRSSSDRGAALLRGPNSFGALIVANGYPAVPSPSDPAPLVGEAYFSGGYNTSRHGSSTGGATDAMQIETHYANVRNSATTRSAFAWALSGALASYLERHYGWKGSAQ